MNNEHLGGEECRSPLLTPLRKSAIDGPPLGRPSCAPAEGGWLRRGRPRWSASPVLGRNSRPVPGHQKVGRMGSPLRGSAIACPRPRAAYGVGPVPGVRGGLVCPPPRATPARGVVRVAVPPSAALACACRRPGGRRRSAGRGAALRRPAKGCSAACGRRDVKKDTSHHAPQTDTAAPSVHISYDTPSSRY